MNDANSAQAPRLRVLSIIHTYIHTFPPNIAVPLPGAPRLMKIRPPRPTPTRIMTFMESDAINARALAGPGQLTQNSSKKLGSPGIP